MNLEGNRVDESIQWNNEWMNLKTVRILSVYIVKQGLDSTKYTRINMNILSFAALLFKTEW